MESMSIFVLNPFEYKGHCILNSSLIGVGVLVQIISLSIEFMIAGIIKLGICFCYTFMLF